MLLINVIGMLIVLVALVHLTNISLRLLHDLFDEAITLQRILDYALAPIT